MPSAVKPSPEPTRYSRARAQLADPVRRELEKLKLPLIHLRKLNGILNALVMQIEDGGDHPEVNRLLIQALRRAVQHQVDNQQGEAALNAIDQLEQADAEYWEAVATGKEPPIEFSDEERLDGLMQEGYMLILANEHASGCDRWLEAWALAKRMLKPHMRTVDDFDAVYPDLTQYFANWTNDLEMELGNAGIDDPAYHEHRLQYAQEFLDLFPGSDADRIVNFKRAQGEALFYLSRRTEADALFESLVQQLPDAEWAYIGWADAYGLFAPPGKTDYARAEAILKRALTRPALQRNPYVLDRLLRVYEKWGKLTEAEAVVKQIEEACSPAEKATKAEHLRFQPASHIGTPKRNDPCWCGSEKKYKHCHLAIDRKK